MRRAVFLSAIVGAVSFSATIADAQMFPLLSGGYGGPKTLMHWADVPPPEEDDDPNPRIITDRPHFAEAATTVGLGRMQIETGYTYFYDDNAGTQVKTHSYPETLLRLGVFREWFEFRFAYNYLSEQSTTGATNIAIDGFDDIYVGAKVALTEQVGYLPELTIFPQARVPTGSSNFTQNEVLPGMNFVYAWMLTEKLELEANSNINRRRDDGLDHYYTEWFQTVNFEYDLCRKMMLFNEFVLIWPNGALAAQTQYYEHAGFHYFFLPNLQLDVHAGVGLNQAADNFFGGSGLSWRW
jgi:hypothetical protein